MGIYTLNAATVIANYRTKVTGQYHTTKPINYYGIKLWTITSEFN